MMTRTDEQINKTMEQTENASFYRKETTQMNHNHKPITWRLSWYYIMDTELVLVPEYILVMHSFKK